MLQGVPNQQAIFWDTLNFGAGFTTMTTIKKVGRVEAPNYQHITRISKTGK